MNIHIILQSKGGVGKSFIASLFNQYLNNLNLKCQGIDIDPQNATYASFRNLNVKRFEILTDEREISRERFDEIIEYISSSDADDIIIDSGASCFIEFSTYLLNNEIIQLLSDMGHDVTIHTIVIGGQGLSDALFTLNQLCANFDVKTTVWLNPFFGEVKNGDKQFIDLPAFVDNQAQIQKIITLPAFKQEFLNDLNVLTTKRLTFSEGINSNDFKLMQKQRFKTMQRKYFEAIEAING